MKRWYRKVRHRKPGIYAYRCRRHLARGTQWGYVGLSNRLDLRDGQHQPKPWYDLVIRRYTVIRLPWWLGWRWVLAPLETAVILLLLPRYNWAKNPRPGKVGPKGQALERLQRQTAGAAVMARYEFERIAWRIVRALAAILIIIGLGSVLL